jgi:hypothetical protein
MEKKVAIIGPIENWTPPDEDTQVWVINNAYRKQEPGRINAVFHMDTLDTYGDSELNREKFDKFVTDVVRLNVTVVCQKHYGHIPKSIPYPLEQICHHFGGLKYFTSSIAYAFALAIATGFERITLPGLNYMNDGWEYAPQKACLDFWAGVAVARGIKLNLPEKSGLIKPWIWQSPLYGYETNKNDSLCDATMAAAYRACMAYPRAFVRDGKESEWNDQHEMRDRVMWIEAKRRRLDWEVPGPDVEMRKITAAEAERLIRAGAVVG